MCGRKRFATILFMSNANTLRYSQDASICMVDDGNGNFSAPTQEDMDALPVGADLDEDDMEALRG